MSPASRNEVLARMRPRYQRWGKAGRSRLVTEACALCGYSRKHAIKVLNGTLPLSGGASPRGGRQVKYGAAHLAVVKAAWLAAEQPCGKRLVGALPVWLPHYERQSGRLDPELRRELLGMSAASLDRLLQPCRVAAGRQRRCGTKPGSLVKQQVAVRSGPWEVEGGTVAHCGGSMAGDLRESVEGACSCALTFVWTLTVTDIHTQWTETRAVWNKGSDGVTAAIADIEAALPFKLLGFDSDNGSEFLNWHLHDYFKKRKECAVNFTRSREYKKNDNAHVEQKNWTHVRQLAGYQRLGAPEQAVRLNQLYTGQWNAFRNFFCPAMKLVSKTRDGGRVTRRYDPAQTPFQRLKASGKLDQDKLKELEQQLANLNPFTLKQELERNLTMVLRDPPTSGASGRPTASRQRRSPVSSSYEATKR